MKTPRMWDFEQVEGKWKAKVSGKFLFYMHQTMGFPVEMAIEEIEDQSKIERLSSQLESWQDFAKENNIDLAGIRGNNEEKKSESISHLNKIFA